MRAAPDELGGVLRGLRAPQLTEDRPDRVLIGGLAGVHLRLDSVQTEGLPAHSKPYPGRLARRHRASEVAVRAELCRIGPGLHLMGVINAVATAQQIVHGPGADSGNSEHGSTVTRPANGTKIARGANGIGVREYRSWGLVVRYLRSTA